MTTTEISRAAPAAVPSEAPTRAAAAPRVGRVALSAAPIAGALLLWHLLTTFDVSLWLRFDKIPSPVEVYDALVVQLGTGRFYGDLLASLRRILAGFLLAALTGVALGVAVGRVRWVAALARPLIEVTRPIPAIALVPLAILLFPTGEQGIVFITWFAAFFPICVSTVHAMRALPTVWEDAARTMGAGRRSVLLHIVLPGAMPGIFSGLSVAMGVAWICVISAEMISGQYGVGYFTWQAYGLLDYPAVVAGMLSIGVLGLGTAWLVERLGRRINRWLPGEARR
ncbi:ABC transporter permease [Thermomonospora umbrina]|uniref:NitT/TauT family transport system permease protein n=1 Tax=Thermomonospora umbrina TaxID=111806 RepID=A0A3D9SRT8_9ACTN|nr:ABC transporter permease [Thermomonospora umbrina]REE95324.1 NitT/TauT family transport system permease protein [Thermomonospora umbrina]